MVNINTSGQVQQARQVLNATEFMAVMSAPSFQRAELLRWLGTPGERRHGGWSGGAVWSWRCPTNDGLWFQASVADDGRVTGASCGPDPRRDAPSDRN